MYQFIRQNFYKIVVAQTLILVITTGLISTGVISQSWSWLGFWLITALVISSPILYGTFFVILAIPFYVILPNPWVSDFPMWRPLFAGLFGWWLVLHFYNIWNKVNGYNWPWQKEFWQKFNPWDKYLALLLLVVTVSLVFARFPAHGLKQLLFILNIALLYIVVVFVVKTTAEFALLKKVVVGSLLIIVALGFIQYFLTFFSQPYYFWQYWALLVSKTYYGVSLAEVLVYSNSWFTSGGGVKALRMFGILQDTHAFGMLSVFALALTTAYLNLPQSITQNLGVLSRFKNFIGNQRKLVMVSVLLMSLAVVLSGTRGIWVGMVPVLLLSLFLVWKKFHSDKFKLIVLAQVLVIFWFLVSPLLSIGFNWIRSFDVDDNILNRAGSIYDLSESSNVGRLQIWQESLSFAVANPLGTGYGNFLTSVVRDIPEGLSFEGASDDINERYNLPQKFITAHNLYLHILVETGLLGLIAFALIVLTVIKRAWYALLGHTPVKLSSRDMFTVIALSFGLTWLLSYAFFDVTILNDRVLMFTFLLLGLLGYLVRFAQKSENNPDFKNDGIMLK